MNTLLDIIEWLELSIDATTDGKRVKERYKMTDNTWKVWYRPDCNIETAYTFLKYWEHTDNDKYLQLSRDIYTSIVKLQKVDGSFPFSHTGDMNIYTNDNSEVPIFLFRMAEIDAEMADTYRATALKCMDFILSIQNANGSWRVVNNDLTETPMFTAHAVSGLATAYKFTDKKEQYKIAIEKGLAYISNNTLESGRVKVCTDMNRGTEWWRPPSSDQSICIRAYAHAEYYLNDNPNVTLWKINRVKLIGWLDKLRHESGAMINGLGEGVNGADVNYITDHVYSTAFCIEAYLWSYLVDNNVVYLDIAKKILNFCENNIFYSDKAETNAVLRGAYNLRDNNFDTSDVTQNGGEEGGGNMIYTGWTNAPIVALFLEITNGIANNNTLVSYFLNNKINRIKLLTEKPNESSVGVFIDNKCYYIEIIDIENSSASDIHVSINNKIKALKM